MNQNYEVISFLSGKDDSTLPLGAAQDQLLFEIFYGTQSVSTYRTNTTSNLTSTPYISQGCFTLAGLLNQLPATSSIPTRVDVSCFTPYPFTSVQSVTQSYFIPPSNRDCQTTTLATNVTSIFWANSRGGFDCFEFGLYTAITTGRSINTITTPQTYQTQKNSAFGYIYQMDYSQTYTTKTRILARDEFDWLGDLFLSKQVYETEFHASSPALRLPSDGLSSRRW